MLKRFIQLSLTERASAEMEALIEAHHNELAKPGTCPQHHVALSDGLCSQCDIEDLTMRIPKETATA